MKMGRKLLNLSGLLALVLIVTHASGQGVPRNLDALLNMQGQPTSDQAAQIDRYSRHWTEQLGKDDVAQVAAAAAELIDPPNNALATPAFRLAYSRATLAGVVKVLDDGTSYQAIQAVKVISFLGSRDAMETLVQRMNSEHEARWKVRLWAAKGAKILLARMTQDNAVTQTQLDRFVRAIGKACDSEDQWIVLLRDFQALASIDRPVSQDEQVRAFKVAIDRMSNDQREPSDLMQAISRVIDNLLMQYLEPGMTPEQKRQFGKELAAQLTRIYAVADQHWDQARSARQTNQAYERAINGCDRLLYLIDANLAAGTNVPKLQPAWESGNKQQFRTETRAWATRVSSPPYTG